MNVTRRELLLKMGKGALRGLVTDGSYSGYY